MIAPCALALTLLFSVSAVAEDGDRFDPVGEVRKDFERLAGMVAAPRPELEITEVAASDGTISNGVVALSVDTIRQAHSRAELNGLLAYLVAKAAAQTRSATPRTMASVGSMVAAGAVIAAGTHIDHRDERDVPPESRRNYGWNPGAGSKRSDPAPGRDALALMQRVDSCSGAALTFMDRLASRDDAAGNRPLHLLAQQAVRDFGSLAAPPDMRCVVQ